MLEYNAFVRTVLTRLLAVDRWRTAHGTSCRVQQHSKIDGVRTVGQVEVITRECADGVCMVWCQWRLYVSFLLALAMQACPGGSGRIHCVGVCVPRDLVLDPVRRIDTCLATAAVRPGCCECAVVSQ
jgi:hypothetical protein